MRNAEGNIHENHNQEEKELYDAEDVKDGVPVDGAKPLYTWESDGKPYDLTDVLLAGESYTLIETKAPAGYLIADPITFTVEETTDTQTISMIDAFRTSSLTLRKLDDKDKPLEGVTFELTVVKSEGDAVGDYRLEEGDSIEATTDENGVVCWDNLNRGYYEIKEIKTVDGETLLSDVIPVRLPLAMSEEKVEAAGNVDTTDAILIDGMYYFFDCTYEISNDVTLRMPTAGGTPMSFCLVIAMACMVAGAFVISKKRKKFV